MKKVKIIELIKFLKYMDMLTVFRLYQQLKTRNWCNKFHNGFYCDPMLHGAGKYVYTGYYCITCNSIHYEFEINKLSE